MTTIDLSGLSPAALEELTNLLGARAQKLGERMDESVRTFPVDSPAGVEMRMFRDALSRVERQAYLIHRESVEKRYQS